MDGKAPNLTPREVEVLQDAADGYDCKWTATRMGISEHTVKKYRWHSMLKLGAETTIQAVAMALRRKLIV